MSASHAAPARGQWVCLALVAVTASFALWLAGAASAQASAVSFAGAVNYPLDSPAAAIAVGKLVNTGNSDVVTVEPTTNEVSIYLSRPDGTLESPKDITVAGEPKAVAIADVTGDGNNDIVVAGTGETITVLPGNGDGTFGTPIVSKTKATDVLGLALGPLAGGSRLDLVTADGIEQADPGYGAIATYLNNGKGEFIEVQTYTASASFHNPVTSVKVGYFHGSNNPLDVVAASTGCSYLGSEGEVWVFKGAGTGVLDPEPTAKAVDSCTVGMNVGEVDQTPNHLPDVVTSNEAPGGEGYVATLTGKGNGELNAATTSANIAAPTGITLPDLTGDGHPDAVVGARGDVVVLEGNGAGGFANPASFAVDGQPVGVTYGDFNGDGRPDVVTANAPSASATNGDISVLMNTTAPATTTAVASPPPPPFPDCAYLTLPGAGSLFGVGTPVKQLDPLPMTVEVRASLDSVSTCASKGEQVSPWYIFPDYTVFPPDPATGIGEFDFEFNSRTWNSISPQSRASNPARLQSRTLFSDNGIAVKTDYSTSFTIAPDGSITLPIAILEGNLQSALLIDSPPQYFALYSKDRSELAAKFNPKDFIKTLFTLEQVVAVPVAIYITAASVASEMVEGWYQLFNAGMFPGTTFEDSQTYEEDLIDALGSSIGVSHLTALGAALGLNKSASGSGLGRPIPIGPSAVAAAGGLSIGTVLVAVLVLARHHHGVPPGAAGLASAAALHTTPVRRVARRALRRAPLPRGELPAVLRSTLALALPAWVAPLVVTERSLRPGSTIDAIATHLRNRRRHDVLLLLTGPGYSAETSLIADRGFAGAAVRLPSRLAPGRWVLAVEDLSAVRLAHGNKLVGHPEDRLGVFTVSARRRRGPGAA